MPTGLNQKNITQNGEHKEKAPDDLLQKGREVIIVYETNTSTFSKPTPRETLEKRGGAHMRFPERIIIYHLELNCTDLNKALGIQIRLQLSHAVTRISVTASTHLERGWR